jgi:hypothetical protein
MVEDSNSAAELSIAGSAVAAVSKASFMVAGIDNFHVALLFGQNLMQDQHKLCRITIFIAQMVAFH